MNNLIANIYGGYKTNKEKVIVRNIGVNRQILELLYNEGYILKWQVKDKKYIWVSMKYFNRRPAVKYIKRVSTAARPIYMSMKELKYRYAMGGGAVIENITGVLFYRNGRDIKYGGKVLFEIR